MLDKKQSEIRDLQFILDMCKLNKLPYMPFSPEEVYNYKEIPFPDLVPDTEEWMLTGIIGPYQPEEWVSKLTIIKHEIVFEDNCSLLIDEINGVPLVKGTAGFTKSGNIIFVWMKRA